MLANTDMNVPEDPADDYATLSYWLVAACAESKRT